MQVIAMLGSRVIVMHSSLLTNSKVAKRWVNVFLKQIAEVDSILKLIWVIGLTEPVRPSFVIIVLVHTI